jgi:hypothetical protein
MNAREGKAQGEQEPGKPSDGPRLDGALPMGKPGQGATVRRDGDGDLDLDLGEIQTRLPYGSEDIADK